MGKKSLGGIEEGYILDDGLRLYDGTNLSNEKLSVEGGMEGLKDNSIYQLDFPELLSDLAKIQPVVFLDIFLENNSLEDYQYRNIFSDFSEEGKNPLDLISDDTIISWCDQKPQDRYPIIASTVTAFSESKESGTYEWKPIIYKIIDKAPQLNLVLESLMKTIKPMACTGSRAELMEKRSVLLTDFRERNESFE